MSLFLDKLFSRKWLLSLGPFHSRLFRRWFRFPFAWIMRCRRWSRRPGLFYVLQIFLWTASFRVNTEIVAWSTVRRILWRFLTCVRHAFFEREGVVLVTYLVKFTWFVTWLSLLLMTHLLVIGFSKAIRGKGLSKNKPTCENAVA